MSDSIAAPRAALMSLTLALAAMAVLPLGLRAANRLTRAPRAGATYLPAFEEPRVRAPFESSRLSELIRLDPAFVIIGDSMAGSRIEPRRLTQLTGRRIAPLEYAGSGSAWWYLALKNWVIASRIHPRAVVIFFRDTNLTDVLFRLDANWALDTAALDREDELNAVVARRLRTPFYRARTLVDRLYGAARARRWIEAVAVQWPARAIFAYRRPRQAFLAQLNDRFDLSHLRPMPAADMQATEDREADFGGMVDRSVLPFMLRDAKVAGLRLYFVRVQRRPVGGRPPYQSPALVRYIAQLKTYVEARGALFDDDTGDPQETVDGYQDGDHLNAQGRLRYTEAFAARLQRRFP